MFDIRFIAPATDSEGIPVRRGRITLGEFTEEFEAPLRVWSAGDYQAQWRAAAERLVRSEPTSGFVVWATDMRAEPYALWWPAWRERGRIALQNQLLFAKEFPAGLDLEAAYAQAHHVEPWFEDEQRPSTWYVEVADVATFLNRLATAFPG